MRLATIAGAMLILTGSAALCQDRSVESRPTIGMGSKSMDSCSADQQRLCGKAPSAVLKECLVTNWTRLSNDCQDAVGTPIDRERGGRRGG